VCETIPEETKQPRLPQLKETGPVYAEVTPAGQHAAKDAVVTVRLVNAEMVIHSGAEPSVIEAAPKALSRIC